MRWRRQNVANNKKKGGGTTMVDFFKTRHHSSVALLLFVFFTTHSLDAAKKNDTKTSNIQEQPSLNLELEDSILHEAAHGYSARFLRFIFTNFIDLDIDETSYDGSTPLHLAVYNKEHNIENMALLLKYGANINAQDIYNITPLHCAASLGDLKAVKLLVQYGANIHAEDKNKWTPLFVAALNGHDDCVLFLIQQKSYIDHQDIRHWTPLMAAAYNGHESTTKLLILQGASTKSLSQSGYTAKRISREKKQDNITKLIPEAVKEYEKNLQDCKDGKESACPENLKGTVKKKEPKKDPCCRLC